MGPTTEGYYWVRYPEGEVPDYEEIVELREFPDDSPGEGIYVRLDNEDGVEDVPLDVFLREYKAVFTRGPLVPPSKDPAVPKDPSHPRSDLGPEEYVAVLPSDEGPRGEAPVLELWFNWDWFITISNPADRTRLPQSIQICTSGSRYPDVSIAFALIYAMLHGKRERALSAAETLVSICKDEHARSWR